MTTPEVENKAIERASYASTPVIGSETLEHVINIAKVMCASGFFPDARTAQQGAALMIMGQQFGLTPAQSLTAIHVVKGKPMLHYSVILARVRQHPDYDYRILEHTDEECSIEFLRKGEPCGTSTFSLADARRAGTQNLDKHARTMLLARAASNGVKWYCPDVLNGMPVYTHGEIPDDEHPAPVSTRDTMNAHLRAMVDEDQSIELQVIPETEPSSGSEAPVVSAEDPYDDDSPQDPGAIAVQGDDAGAPFLEVADPEKWTEVCKKAGADPGSKPESVYKSAILKSILDDDEEAEKRGLRVVRPVAVSA